MFSRLNKIKLFFFYIGLIIFIYLFIQYACSSKKLCLKCIRDLKTIKEHEFFLANLPPIHLITPTYFRNEQLADLTRLGQTLLLVKNVHWIIVEDSTFKTKQIVDFIDNFDLLKYRVNSNIKITHLNVATPAKYKIKENQPHWYQPKGVLQRNLALDFLSKTSTTSYLKEGVIYFLDDDNTYDIRIFDEMRFTNRVSIWPVGLVGEQLVEKPILNNKKKVDSFNSIWKPQRKFPVDMAAFAVNLRFFLTKNKVRFSYKVPIGYQETYFLTQLIDSYEQLEPKANYCQAIYVWHTKTMKFRVRNFNLKKK